MSLSRFSKNRMNSELQFDLTERPTAYQWIDGKRIYRKTIDFGALPNATSKTVSHMILGLDNIIALYGWAKSTATFIPLPYPNGTPIELFASSAEVTIDAGAADRSAFTTSYVIIEYTKT